MNTDVEKEAGVGSSKMCDSGVERTGAWVGGGIAIAICASIFRGNAVGDLDWAIVVTAWSSCKVKQILGACKWDQNRGAIIFLEG